MRFDIRYVTTFRYPGEVVESQNELRAAPVSDHRQQLVHYDVRTTPSSRVTSYTDYWGTQVDCFGVVERHTRLTVVADAVVETLGQQTPDNAGAWPLAGQYLGADDEYLSPSPHVTWAPEIVEFGREAVAATQAAWSGA